MKRACLAALLLAAACAPSARRAPPEPALRVDESLDTGADRFEVAFVAGPAGPGRVVFEKKDGSFYQASVTHASGRTCRPPGGDWDYLLPSVSTAGVVGFRGADEVFVSGTAGGTGRTDVALLLIDPSTCAVTGLEFVIAHDDTKPVTPQLGLGSYGGDSRAAETRFLDGIKRRYGYRGIEDVETHPEDPRFAYYFWARDNGSIRDGRMRIRRFQGRPALNSSTEAEFTASSVTYTASFKSGVVAYDTAKDEHYVLFHPRDPYSWPTALAKLGDVLLIGTRGEGAAAIGLKNFRLKRFPLGEIRSIEVYSSSVTVNGATPLDLKGF